MSAPVNLELSPPTIDEFLQMNPLPPQLAYLEPTLRTLPNFEVMFDTILGCAGAGLDDAGITQALETIVTYNQQDAHRCTCCLAWRSGGRSLGRVVDGGFSILFICEPCSRLIELGRVTPTMRRNLRGYLEEGQ